MKITFELEFSKLNAIKVHMTFTLLIRSHMKCGTCMFFIVLKPCNGFKMCPQIFVPDLAPSLLQTSKWYITDTYRGWSWCAGQSIGLLLTIPQNAGHFDFFKKSHFCNFIQIYFGYSSKNWQGYCLCHEIIFFSVL